ncbi:MAG: hypothetical protein P8Z37_15390 [Acidobacteriota bacterium]
MKRRDIYFDDLPIPKTRKKLPVVLRADEIIRFVRRQRKWDTFRQ